MQKLCKRRTKIVCFLEKKTSLLGGKLAHCPVENVASAVVPVKLVGEADTKVTPTGDGGEGGDNGDHGDGGDRIVIVMVIPMEFEGLILVLETTNEQVVMIMSWMINSL